MDFPPYVYQEYPKEVSRKDGTRVVVGSQSEEIKLLATDQSEPVVLADPERDAMMSRIRELEEQIAAQAQAKTSAPAPSGAKTGPASAPASTPALA